MPETQQNTDAKTPERLPATHNTRFLIDDAQNIGSIPYARQILDAKTREAKKSKLDQARDTAYTVNHAGLCTGADILGAPINAAIQHYWPGGRITCTHEGHNHGHGGEKRSGSNVLAHVLSAEFASDILAVPVTIMIQRKAPWFIDGISKTIEPLFGDLFRMGAKGAAHMWAKKNGLDPNGPEALAKARDTYHHEAEHLGQAVVWTASAFGLNIGFQSMTETVWPPKGGRTPLKVMLGAKGIGSTVTSAALVGLRGFGPGVAERWDDWTSTNIFMPITRKVSKWIGVPDDAVKAFEKEEDADDKYWDHVVAQAKQKKAGAASAKPAAIVSDVTDHAVQVATPALSA